MTVDDMMSNWFLFEAKFVEINPVWIKISPCRTNSALPLYKSVLTFVFSFIFSDLSNNAISVLPPFIFSNLTRLSTLIVSYNQLQCVQENSFHGLRNLRILSLHGNQISMIPELAFDTRASVTHLWVWKWDPWALYPLWGPITFSPKCDPRAFSQILGSWTLSP